MHDAHWSLQQQHHRRQQPYNAIIDDKTTDAKTMSLQTYEDEDIPFRPPIFDFTISIPWIYGYGFWFDPRRWLLTILTRDEPTVEYIHLWIWIVYLYTLHDFIEDDSSFRFIAKILCSAMRWLFYVFIWFFFCFLSSFHFLSHFLFFFCGLSIFQ